MLEVVGGIIITMGVVFVKAEDIPTGNITMKDVVECTKIETCKKPWKYYLRPTKEWIIV